MIFIFKPSRRRINMLTITQLMNYLKNIHSIEIKSHQKQSLRNIGYYHGFKGYRFIRESNKKINFTSFNEILALNEFDMQLKTLFYPNVMMIENALKSYVIESILKDSASESLDHIFNISITQYKSYMPGSNEYNKQYSKRLTLKGKINSALLRDYSNRKPVVSHFFNSDRNIPIWAIFESLTLGEFGTFFSCSNKNVKLYTSKLINLPNNFDSDGKITEYIIYAIKDLRNAIAHNNIIFDARFKSNNINMRLIHLLENELEIKNINFKYIDAYIILITYVMRKMGTSKRSCKQFVNSFIKYTEILRSKIDNDICNQIFGTSQRYHLNQLLKFISKI